MRKKIVNLLFSNNGGRQTALKNFAWLSASNIGSRFLKGLITIYAARRLGAESYGIFSYAFGLAGFFIFFKNIGIDAILTREIAKKPEAEHHLFSTALAIEIVLLVITAFLVIFVAPFFSKIGAATILLPLVAFILIFDDLKDFFVAFFRGKEKMELEALVVVTANLAVVIFGFLVLRLYPTPYALTTVYALSSAMGVLIAVLLLRPLVSRVFYNFDRSLVAPMLKSAWPIAIGGFASVFLFNVDIVMLGWWRTSEEIGFYSAAQRVVGILSIFSSLIATTTFPALSRFARSDLNSSLKNTIETILTILFIAAIPLVIGGVILRHSLLEFIFGSSYILASNPFIILLFSILALFPMTIFYNLIFAFDKQSKAVSYAIITSLTNLSLNFILIPRFGMLGAAIATTSSTFLYTGLMWNLSRTIIKFRILSRLFKVVISAGFMGGAVYFLQLIGLHVIVNIIFSSALYFLSLYILKEKTIEEIFTLLRSPQSSA